MGNRGAEAQGNGRSEREGEITALVLRYRRGEQDVLAELYAQLEGAINRFLARYSTRPYLLPAALEMQDLHQQSYVALAEAALEWQPERGNNFIPYFRVSFPWRIDRYLRSQTPSRRSTRFRMGSVPHDELVEGMSAAVGLDGRDWDGALASAEMMHGLPERYARVVQLRLEYGLTFGEIGEATGVGRSAAHELFGRAVSLLKLAVLPGGRDSRVDARPEPPATGAIGVDAASLRRCVETLHRLAPGSSPVPGREVLCRAAGLTWREYRGIMARLRLSGCLVGRRRGSTGSLACATPEETMRRLEATD